MDEYERYMERDPAVGRTFSIADLLSNGGSALKEFYPKWNVLPTTARGTGQLLGGLLAARRRSRPRTSSRRGATPPR